MRRAAPLLLGCAAAALTAAPETVRAQAFTANPTTVAGNVTYDRATPGVETITVNTPSAVINWDFVSPIGNPITFLPTGNTATFQNSVNNPTFAVLNRITPSGAPILMDGNVISQLQTLGGGTVPGGTVIFSSPTGIIIGSKAVFDVGRLMLTSLDPILNAGGEFLVGGNIVLADGSSFPNAAVVTQPGSLFRAPAEGSWVVFAAPQVTHGGSVRVNGSAAYVGAEIVSITINEGLFDINIETGSTQANPVVHTGITGGPASTGAPDNHMIAMVASPQTAPMTMLLSGSVGFDAAVSAAVENGAIVLSAGHDIVGTQIDPFPNEDIPASARITGGTFTSDVTGRARSQFIAGNTGPGTLTFTQDVRIAGYEFAHLTADGGFAVTVGGDAVVSAANLRPVGFGAAINIVGGEAMLRASAGSTINVAGNATVDASARGRVDDTGAGSGTGGQALVAGDTGTVDIAGNLTVLSTGTGGSDPAVPPPARGGNGSGGTALASALSDGTLHVGGNLLIDATGTGTAGTGATPGTGSIGTGGTARVEALNSGAVRIDGATNAVASGVGGQQDGAAPNVGGAGQGGTAGVRAAAGTIDLTGPVSLTANGSGGSGPQGGTGAGGTAFVEALQGRATLAGAAQLRADATGGGGATQGTAAGGTLLVRAVAQGGSPPARVQIGPLDGISLATGNPAGGNLLGRWIFTAVNGTIQLGTANLNASANGPPGLPTASEFQLQDGTVTVAGQGNFLTDGEIRLSAAGSGRLDGGNLLLNGRAGIFLTHAGRAAGAFTVDAGTFGAITLNDYLAALGTAVSGNGIDIRAGRDATLAQTNATGLLNVNAGNDVTVAAAATGADIRIAAGRDARIAAGGSIGDAATATVSVQAAQDFTAAAGTVVRGGTIDIRAGRTATLAQTNAAAALNVTAGGTARFNSAATGGQITVASADIDVPAGGSIGNAGTTLVSLQVQPQANETSLGGAEQGPGYTLTEAEAGRLQGAIVRVSAPGGAAGPAGSSRIVVRNLSLSATAVQAFEIATPGIVRVDGPLLLANAGAANRIGIAAGTRLEVATPSGGVRVRDAAGAPAGSLTVAAGDIWVTDPQTLGLLAADPDFAGRDQVLETNQGADNPRGWIEAGAITLAPQVTLFVQNSGTPGALAGLTVGSGRLTIRPSGDDPASVFAFGRRLNPDGSSTVNVPFFFQVDYSFADTAGYTNDSEFNGCFINNPRCGAPFGGVPGGSRDFVLRSFPIPPQEPPGEAVDEDAFAADPLIEEPVTSGSDSTLWFDPDDELDDEDDDDEDERREE
jgi:filamentous hemagglutinin family protein